MASKWVIVTEVGGLTFLQDVRKGSAADVPVFTGNLDHAKRFETLGDVMEVLAMLPARLDAYEEDPAWFNYLRNDECPI